MTTNTAMAQGMIKPRLDKDWTVTALLSEAGENSLLWRAENQQGDLAAIKIPRHIDNPARNAKRRKRFNNEIELMELVAQLGIKSVMPVLSHGLTSDGKPWYAMPIATPVDLSTPFAIRLDVLTQLSTIIDDLHQAGIEHLDIKLGNVMMIDGALVLSDFGLSKKAADPVALLEKQTELDPERPWFDYDIYSLGKACWQILTGLPPKSLRELSSPEDDLQPHWSAVDPALIGKLQVLLFAACSKDPRDRPLAAEFNQTLHEIYHSAKYSV